MGAGYSAEEHRSLKPVNVVNFTINGKPFTVNPSCSNNTITPTTSLNTFIRDVAQLKGTKMMCFEGGCGSCIVAAEFIHPVTHERVHVAVNSCLVTVLSCQGWSITTVEGIGNKKDGYHIVQQRLADFNGTQCGYCSPGMVMNMYSLYETNENLTVKDIENSFGGNICRCTGYRPICDAFKSLAVDADSGLIAKVKPSSSSRDCCRGGRCCTEMIEKPQKTYISIEVGTEKWYKVYKLQELLAILNSIGDSKYMLVAGNTANGVFRRPSDISIYIDVNSIAELHDIRIGNELKLGGNVSLSETMKIFAKVAGERVGFKYLQEIHDHIDLVANVPVRNIGTLAGNLMIKHTYPRFQSDIFLSLETFGAKLTIVSRDGTITEVSPLEFLDLNMTGKVITQITMYPLSGYYVFRSYKIMPRSQNTHAIVNAGFCIKLGDDMNTVNEATIVYGAINTNFTHAKVAESVLFGQKLFDDTTLQKVYKALDCELKCDKSPPDPTPEARKQLAIALFYKFVLSVAPEELVNEKYRSGGPKFDRKVSSGQQIFETQRDKYPLTEPIPKIEALVQCSGEAKYVVDFDTSRADFHFGIFILATVEPGSTILKINTKAAESIPGVAAILTSKDIIGRNSFIPAKPVFITNFPEEIFCSEEVKYNGQPVGLVVADSLSAAYQGAAMVKIEYGESKKRPVYSTRDAINIANNPRTKLIRSHPRTKTGHHIRKVFQGSMDLGTQYHFTMETQTCVCLPIEDGLDVYPSHQWMDLAQIGIAECCNIPEKSINVNVRRLGGGYGAKIARANLIACACALAATKINKPVYIHMPMEDNVKAIGKRFPCSVDYEVAVDDFGTIQYLNLSYYSNYGYLSNELADTFLYPSLINCYDTSTWEIRGYSVETDVAANCYMRAPGTCEAVAMMEAIMDHIAIKLGIDAGTVRMQNLPAESPLLGLMESFKKESELDDRIQSINNFNKKNRWRKRGIGLVVMSWPFDYAGNFYSQVSIYRDGTVAISHGGIEMGQGINTKVAQVAAYTLGVDISKVQVKPSNSFTAPNNLVSGASIASESVSFATLQACQVLKTRMEPIKKKLIQPTWEDTVNKSLNELTNLTSTYQFTSADKVSSYSIYGVTFAEVEVDLLTGVTEINRVDLLEDTGESISPEIDIGQIEGAFVTGLGYWLSEEMQYDSNGAALNTRTWTYHPPGMKDIPIDWRIRFRSNSYNANGVLGSKATGEPPLCMSVAVPLAIRQALISARQDSDSTSDPWVPFDGPTTASEVLLKSLPTYGQYVLK